MSRDVKIAQGDDQDKRVQKGTKSELQLPKILIRRHHHDVASFARFCMLKMPCILPAFGYQVPTRTVPKRTLPSNIHTPEPASLCRWRKQKKTRNVRMSFEWTKIDQQTHTFPFEYDGPIFADSSRVIKSTPSLRMILERLVT